MYPINLTNKTALIFGVANHRSIAWSIAKTLHLAGANLILAYQNERLKDNIVKITKKNRWSVIDYAWCNVCI